MLYSELDSGNTLRRPPLWGRAKSTRGFKYQTPVRLMLR
nr:MAG TPA: hypothetical protein [Caudoviricetes sp.]